MTGPQGVENESRIDFFYFYNMYCFGRIFRHTFSQKFWSINIGNLFWKIYDFSVITWFLYNAKLKTRQI